MAGSSEKSAIVGEAAPAVIIKASTLLNKGTRQPEDDSETKVDRKKQKKDVKKSEKKEMMQGFADMVQRLEAKIDLLEAKVDLLVTKADEAISIAAKGKKDDTKKPSSNSESSDMDTSSDDQVTATKKPDAAATNVSVKHKTENSSSSGGGNGQTIRVVGFNNWLPVDDIKSALTKHFSSFGEITRVFVPADSVTGYSLGYAYIDLKEGAEKVLELVVHYVRGWKLLVSEAEPIRSGSTWPYPGRCGSQGRCSYC